LVLSIVYVGFVWHLWHYFLVFSVIYVYVVNLKWQYWLDLWRYCSRWKRWSHRRLEQDWKGWNTDNIAISQYIAVLSFSRSTCTHSFNGPFSGTTQLSRYQKGKTNLDFTEARNSEWQWHQLGHMQVCTLLQTDSHTRTHHSVFYRPDALPAAQPTVSKHWR